MSSFRRVHSIRVRDSTIRLGDILTPIGAVFRIGNVSFVVAECQCGKRIVLREQFVSKQTCGCKKTKRIADSARTHGKTGTPEFKSWRAMKKRCSDKKNVYYFGRGVTIHESWIHSFEQFFLDRGKKPFPEATIDRFPDKFGNYEPGNCRWASWETQRTNRSDNVNVTIYGKTMDVSKWEKISGIKYSTIYHRIKKGWPSKAAVFAPVGMGAMRYSE